MLRIGPERPAPIDHRDALRLRLNNQPLDDTAAGERYDVARIERQHLLVAPEPGALAKAPVEPERDLRDLALLGPGGGEPVDAPAVAAMHEQEVGGFETPIRTQAPQRRRTLGSDSHVSRLDSGAGPRNRPAAICACTPSAAGARRP